MSSILYFEVSKKVCANPMDRLMYCGGKKIHILYGQKLHYTFLAWAKNQAEFED